MNLKTQKGRLKKKNIESEDNKENNRMILIKLRKKLKWNYEPLEVIKDQGLKDWTILIITLVIEWMIMWMN